MGNVGKHKQNLVRTAMRLFRRQGYASTGLQQILVESGAPKGSLYHYFPDGKESLAEAAVLMAGELVAELLTELGEKHAGDPRGFVAAYCRTMADWMEESAYRSGCPIATTMLETVPASKALTQAGGDILDAWIVIASKVFADSGLSTSQARQRAQFLIAAMEGALIVARIRQSKRPILDVAKFF